MIFLVKQSCMNSRHS